MNRKQIAILAVMIAFGALTAVPLYQYGVLGVFGLVLANSATIQVSVDLVISLSLIAIWIWSDARERGISALPYLVLTALAGSFGPLLYLFKRFGVARTT